MLVCDPIVSVYYTSMEMRSRKIVKFVISGGMAAGTEFTIFFILHSLGLLLIASHVLSFLCGLGVSFTLNKRWVFSHKGKGTSQFAAYTLLALVNLTLGSGLIILLNDGFNIPTLLSKVLVMAIIATWNFIIYERIIFKHKPPLEPAD